MKETDKQLFETCNDDQCKSLGRDEVPDLEAQVVIEEDEIGEWQRRDFLNIKVRMGLSNVGAVRFKTG